MLEALGLIFFLALVIERITDRIVKGLPSLASFAWGISWLLGLAIAFGYRLDILAALGFQVGFTDGYATWTTIALTGTILGGGSNFVKEIVDLVKARRDEARANIITDDRVEE